MTTTLTRDEELGTIAVRSPIALDRIARVRSRMMSDEFTDFLIAQHDAEFPYPSDTYLAELDHEAEMDNWLNKQGE